MAMRRFVTVGPALVVLLAGALLLVAGPGVVRRLWAAKTTATIDASHRALASDDLLARIDLANRLVAQSVTPSVVHVDVTLEGHNGSTSGAGWVFDTEGHIVTNAHVVANSRRLQVQYQDGYTQPAELVGMDVYTDIAVLRVEPGPSLFPLKRATGIRVEQGDRVFAFGSPFGLKFSISQGIVSGLGRSAHPLLGFAGISNYIQTDAAVNPGNSGGPLVDSRGELIGMNVAIANAANTMGTVTEGQSAGISFAIPLGTIEARVPQIIEKGRTTPALMGIRYNPDGDTFVDQDGYRGQSVLVNSIEPDGPADHAGILPGDRLLSIDGQTLSNVDVMRAIISNARPDQVVKIKVWRDQSIMELAVKLEPASLRYQHEQELAILNERVGIVCVESNGGILITRVWPGRPAFAAGFQVGMMIEKIGDAPVQTRDDLARALYDEGLSEGKRVLATLRLSDGSESQLYLRVFPLSTMFP